VLLALCRCSEAGKEISSCGRYMLCLLLECGRALAAAIDHHDISSDIYQVIFTTCMKVHDASGAINRHASPLPLPEAWLSCRLSPGYGAVNQPLG
jgi:hypothetical protein